MNGQTLPKATGGTPAAVAGFTQTRWSQVFLAGQGLLLKGISWGNSDLRRLVAEGTLVLGGPAHPSPVDLELLAQNADGSAVVRVNRTGDLSAAMRVPILFAGSGYAMLDYTVLGAGGSGDVQYVELGRGVASADLTLRPQSWSLGRSLVPELTPLGVYQASLPGETLQVQMLPVAAVSLQVVRHLQAGGGEAGVVKVSRLGGSSTSALELDLSYHGTLVSGQDVIAPMTQVTIPAGQESLLVYLYPLRALEQTASLGYLEVAVTEGSFRYGWEQSGLPDTPENREKLLGQLIHRLLYVQAALEAGLDRDPEVAHAVDNILSSRLRQLQLEPLLSAVNPDEGELDAYYQAHREQLYRVPERVHAAVLWFNTRGQPPLEERYKTRLEDLRKGWEADPSSLPKVEDGFGAAAIRNSEHRPSLYRGGDVGWLQAEAPGIPMDSWQQRVFGIASGLTEPGALSDVVVEPEGVFLVRLLGHEEGRVRSFDEVKADIHQRLTSQLKQARTDEFEQALRRKFAVHSSSEAVRQLKLPSGPAK